jgi:hypothetical protein
MRRRKHGACTIVPGYQLTAAVATHVVETLGNCLNCRSWIGLRKFRVMGLPRANTPACEFSRNETISNETSRHVLLIVMGVGEKGERERERKHSSRDVRESMIVMNVIFNVTSKKHCDDSQLSHIYCDSLRYITENVC